MPRATSIPLPQLYDGLGREARSAFEAARSDLADLRFENERPLDLARVSLLLDPETKSYTGSRAVAYALQLRFVSDPLFRRVVTEKFGGDLMELTQNHLARHYEREPPTIIPSLPRLDPAVEAILMRFTGAIQLSEGCSIGCAYCGFNAKHGVGELFAFEVLHYLFTRYGRDLARNDVFLYWGSDPFDYEKTVDGSDRVVRYEDLARLARALFGVIPFGSTAVPRQREAQVKRALDVVDRISVSGVNRTRLKRVWPEAVPDDSRHLPPELQGVCETILVVPKLSARTRGRTLANEQTRDREFGIGCIDGVLLRPSGFANVVQVGWSEKFPEAQVVQPIDAGRFRVRLPSTGTIEEILSMSAVHYTSRKEARVQPAMTTGVYLRPGITFVEVTNVTGSRAYVLDSVSGRMDAVDRRFAVCTRQNVLRGMLRLEQAKHFCLTPPFFSDLNEILGLDIPEDGAELLNVHTFRKSRADARAFIDRIDAECPTPSDLFERTLFRTKHLEDLNGGRSADGIRSVERTISWLFKLVPRYRDSGDSARLIAEAFTLAAASAAELAAIVIDLGPYGEHLRKQSVEIVPSARHLEIRDRILWADSFVEDVAIVARKSDPDPFGSVRP